jgi:hypothetical protein
MVRGLDNREVAQFDGQTAVPEDLLHMFDESAGSLETGSGALFGSPLGSNSFWINAVNRGDSFFLSVDPLTGAACLADVHDLIDLAHVKRIEVDQLRFGILSEDFLPEFDRILQAGQER